MKIDKQNTSAKQSFFNLSRELEVSNRFAKKTYSIYKHLPIKENDKVLLIGKNDLLATWLISYGMASQVECVVDEKSKDLEDGSCSNWYLKENKPYLPEITFSSKFDMEPLPDLVIFFNQDIHSVFNYYNSHTFFHVSNEKVFRNNKLPKFYINLSRQMGNFLEFSSGERFLQIKQYLYYRQQEVSLLSNDVKHYLYMTYIETAFRSIEHGVRPVRLVRSFPYNKSILYKDLVVGGI